MFTWDASGTEFARVDAAGMSRTALIIDPDPASLKLQAVILRGEGWLVVTALTIADARNALGVFAPDVVVDGIGGDATMELLHELTTRKIPVIAVEEREARSRSAASSTPITVSVTKPIDVTTFARLVDSARGGRS
jgi:DNA-binding NtrC family response regulator